MNCTLSTAEYLHELAVYFTAMTIHNVQTVNSLIFFVMYEYWTRQQTISCRLRNRDEFGFIPNWKNKPADYKVKKFPKSIPVITPNPNKKCMVINSLMNQFLTLNANWHKDGACKKTKMKMVGRQIFQHFKFLWSALSN